MTTSPPKNSSWYLVRVQLNEPSGEHAWDLFTVLANDAGSAGNQDFLSGELIGGGEFYFDASDHDPRETVTRLEALLLQLNLPHQPLLVEEVDPLNWIQTGKRFYEARSITDRFVVGSEEEREKFANQNVDYISIEYGAAFGTGSHPTTALSLQFLQEHLQPGLPVFDFGTGTGVLSFAALFLGASVAYCIDCSEDAEPIFRLNAERNHFSDRVFFHLGSSPRDVHSLAQNSAKGLPWLILCNMLLSDSEGLLQDLRELNAPMIYSGYLEGQSVVVRLALEQAGFSIEEEAFSEDWGVCYCVPEPK